MHVIYSHYVCYGVFVLSKELQILLISNIRMNLVIKGKYFLCALIKSELHPTFQM